METTGTGTGLLACLRILFHQHPVRELVDLGFTPPVVPLVIDQNSTSYYPLVVVQGNLGIP